VIKTKNVQNFKGKIGLYAILFILLNYSVLIVSVNGNSTYQSALTKGTDFFKVSVYHKDKWTSTFTEDVLPSNFFKGESNITGAESKLTLRGYTNINLDFYGILSNFFFTGDQLAALISLDAYGYNESEINNLYSDTFQLTFGLRAVWYFTTSEFQETPNATANSVFIFQDPSQYKDILDQYNDFVDVLKNDTLIPLIIRSSLVNYTSNEFLTNLAFNGLALGIPTTTYLESIITELAPTNVSYSADSTGNPSLILTGFSKNNYSIAFKYGSDGVLMEFKVLDVNGAVIYLITSYNTEWIFFLVLFIFIGISGLIIGIYLYMRKKRLKK